MVDYVSLIKLICQHIGAPCNAAINGMQNDLSLLFVSHISTSMEVCEINQRQAAKSETYPCIFFDYRSYPHPPFMRMQC